MKPASQKQIQALHIILHKKGLMQFKKEMVESFSNGRTSSSKELTMAEARDLLSALYGQSESPVKQDKAPMIRKLFGMCHEIGWITKKMVISENGGMEEVNDNTRVYEWVTNFGYLRKELRKYTYNELPKLVSVFEENIYVPYIRNLANIKDKHH
jgi:hypothetical protein